MALEIRMIGPDGKPVRTVEDVTVPDLPYELQPGSLVLADYCFNENGPWIKPDQILHSEDVAAVVYSRRGQLESMVVGNKRIHDEEVMRRTLHALHGTTMTKYPGNERGKEVFMFYLSPRVKRRLREWRKR